MTYHDEMVVQHIRANHVKIPGQRRCVLDGQRMPCGPLVEADTIEGTQDWWSRPFTWREAWQWAAWLGFVCLVLAICMILDVAPVAA